MHGTYGVAWQWGVTGRHSIDGGPVTQQCLTAPPVCLDGLDKSHDSSGPLFLGAAAASYGVSPVRTFLSEIVLSFLILSAFYVPLVVYVSHKWRYGEVARLVLAGSSVFAATGLFALGAGSEAGAHLRRTGEVSVGGLLIAGLHTPYVIPTEQSPLPPVYSSAMH